MRAEASAARSACRVRWSALLLLLAALSTLWAAAVPRVFRPAPAEVAALQRELIGLRKRLRLLRTHGAGVPMTAAMDELRLLIHEWLTALDAAEPVKIMGIRFADRVLSERQAVAEVRFHVLRLDLTLHLPGAAVLLQRLDRLQAAAGAWPMEVRECALDVLKHGRLIRAQCVIDFYHDDAPRGGDTAGTAPLLSRSAGDDFTLFHNLAYRQRRAKLGRGDRGEAGARTRSDKTRRPPSKSTGTTVRRRQAGAALVYNGFVSSEAGTQYLVNGRPWRARASGIAAIEAHMPPDRLRVHLIDGSQRELSLGSRRSAATP